MECSIQDELFQVGVASCAFCPIKLQDSLIINISGRNQVISQFFCMELVIKGRQHLRLTILGVASCASHSIRLQDSDHQYICKESTNLFDFLHEDDHQGKVPCKTISFGQVCRLYLSANQIAGFFDHQYLWKESSDLSMDLYVEIVKVALVWLVVSLIQSDRRIL